MTARAGRGGRPGRRRRLVGAALAAVAALAACGDDGPGGPADVHFDLDADTSTFATFWDLPFPSDLRTNPDGTLDLAGFPNRRGVPVVDDLLGVARLRAGAPQMPVVYTRFAIDVPERRHRDVVPASAEEDVFLVDVDPASPERGRLVPVVVETLYPDDFAPRTLVGVAPRPGIVLAPATTYALVFRRGFAPGAAPPPDWVALRDGRLGDGPRAARAREVYAPLWPALEALGVPADDVLVATVLTTGDETRRMYERSEGVRAAHAAVIGALAIDPDDGDAHDGFCELVGTVTFPQFQRGTQPFHTGGDFELDAAGVPVAQGSMTVPLTITIPAREMPPGGWPLYQFFHGSGGLSSGVVDLGKTLVPDGEPEVGKGPGYVVALRGIAAASSALPVNPERLPGAKDYEYLNINNLAALPFTFEQGVLEQRLLLDALLDLAIAPEVLAGCPGVSLPAGATSHRFDPAKVVAGGQSMGGMYTNMTASVEPRYGALVPTGAGGFWNHMILEARLVPGARELLGAAFSTSGERLSFMHPALALIGLGWGSAEPMVAMSRLARRPLDAPGFAPRHVYQPVGYDDVYFPTSVFDAAALAYGNQQAGEVVWDMQAALALDGLGGVLSYPVAGNRDHGGGTVTTSVVVQYESDGIADAHYLYRQLDAVKHQYACFLRTFLDEGVPRVVAPGALDDPC